MTGQDSSPVRGSPEEPNAPEAELDNVRAEVASLRQQLAEASEQVQEQAHHARAGPELQHRARNTMALVRSVFRRTVQTGRSLEEVEMHFCGRLDVLAHYMLPHSGRWNATVDVENIVREELRSFEFGYAPGITITGPDVALSMDQAQSFALMIHELVTNALKFGALWVKNATLSVTWKVQDASLKLVWSETGVPIVVSAPVARGFGQEFIEEALPYQIGAATRFERRPGGVVCTMELQLVPPHPNERTANRQEP